MNAKIKNEFKHILQEFNIKTKSDFEKLSGEEAARFYENIKAALMEDHDLDEGEIEALIKEEFYKDSKNDSSTKPLTFKQAIKKSVGKVLLDNGHKVNFLSSRVVYFAKRFSEELAFYICFNDYRMQGEGIKITFYFSPIHNDDDSLMSLGVGIKIHLGNIMEEDIISPAIAYGNKILSIENSIGCYEDMIMSEMKNPFVTTKGFEHYIKHNYYYYNTLKNCDEIKTQWNLLHENVINDIRKNNFKKSYEICKEFIDSLDNEFLRKVGIDVSEKYFYDNFAEAVCVQCYLDT